MKTMMEALEEQLEMSMRMLVEAIKICPDELWGETVGGFPFWQQVLHALAGADYWLRLESEPYEEIFAERRLFPDLDGLPRGAATKEELRSYSDSVRARARRFIAATGELSEPSREGPRPSRLDLILIQLRHLMYHVGACDAILRERGHAASSWLESQADRDRLRP